MLKCNAIEATFIYFYFLFLKTANGAPNKILASIAMLTVALPPPCLVEEFDLKKKKGGGGWGLTQSGEVLDTGHTIRLAFFLRSNLVSSWRFVG